MLPGSWIEGEKQPGSCASASQLNITRHQGSLELSVKNNNHEVHTCIVILRNDFLTNSTNAHWHKPGDCSNLLITNTSAKDDFSQRTRHGREVGQTCHHLPTHLLRTLLTRTQQPSRLHHGRRSLQCPLLPHQSDHVCPSPSSPPFIQTELIKQIHGSRPPANIRHAGLELAIDAVFHLRSRAADIGVAHLEIACDAALSYANDYNELNPE